MYYYFAFGMAIFFQAVLSFMAQGTASLHEICLESTETDVSTHSSIASLEEMYGNQNKANRETTWLIKSAVFR